MELLSQAQQEYKDTMEAATAAKLEAEKRKHERALQYLDDEMRNMKDRLRQVRSLILVMDLESSAKILGILPLSLWRF